MTGERTREKQRAEKLLEPAQLTELRGGIAVSGRSAGPNFRNDPAFLPILAAQRAGTETLAADGRTRGWGSQAARHCKLAEQRHPAPGSRVPPSTGTPNCAPSSKNTASATATRSP